MQAQIAFSAIALAATLATAAIAQGDLNRLNDPDVQAGIQGYRLADAQRQELQNEKSGVKDSQDLTQH
ncbi:MAG: hypothetical protein JWQ76_3258 [Ramlibacter sp.]|nr:hypothetical protein [Ramlibacter sp.]